jgi:hypothetical protein
MKKSAVLFIVLSILLAACGAAPSNLKESDLSFALDGKSYALKTDAQPLLDALGSGYALIEAPSCLYQGNDKTFEYESIVIYTIPVDGKDIIDEIDLTGGSYETSRGIKIGDTLEDIRKAYGESYFDDGGIIEYNLSGDKSDIKSPKIYFEMTDGKVSCIGLYSASNIVQ